MLIVGFFNIANIRTIFIDLAPVLTIIKVDTYTIPPVQTMGQLRKSN